MIIPPTCWLGDERHADVTFVVRLNEEIPGGTTAARSINGFQVEQMGFCKMTSKPCGKHDAPYQLSLSLSRSASLSLSKNP